MLVIVSDLHFQHVSLDGVRYIQAGIVRETGVRRNVSPGAFQMLLTDVCELAERNACRVVELVFAGDIFELLRTPLWYAGGTIGLRPTQADLGPDSPSNPLCAKVHLILDAIAHDNRGCWSILDRFVRERQVERFGRTLALAEGTEVRVNYIPGNHDRLANAWPSVRRRVRELLSMPPSGDPFPHVVDRPAQTGYGVRIRHGHEYDRSNIGVPVEFGKPITLTDDDYLKPCLGDYVTLDVAARLGVAFRILYAGELHGVGEPSRRLRAFYNALIEFDDVRPPTLLMTYLAKRLDGTNQEIFRLLRPILLDLYLTAARDPFVLDLANRLALIRYITDPVYSMVREAIQDLSPSSLSSLIRRVQAMNTSDDTVRGAAMARHEDGLDDGTFDVIIAGHTHHPDQIPLPSSPGNEREAFFLDVGTWRSSIRYGVDGAFARLRSYTVAFCYSDEERRASADSRRFETWTGHLAAGDSGPYDVELGPVGPVCQRFRARAVRVVRMDEGDTRDGAELELHWGVDGAPHTLRRENVHDGDRIEIDAVPVNLHSELFGELWAWGSEVDLGKDSLFDSDDPLPWALSYLPRASASDFVPGPGELTLCSHDGTHLVLEYEIIPAD